MFATVLDEPSYLRYFEKVQRKRKLLQNFQRLVANPIGRRLPLPMLETTGRKSGEPRRTALGGRLIGNQFWLVSEHGEHAQYVRNIKANPAVRVRIAGKWRSGTAHLMPHDDPWERLKSLPRVNSAGVRLAATDLLSICIELD